MNKDILGEQKKKRVDEIVIAKIIVEKDSQKGILIGKKAGTKLAGKAGIFGGAILIFIGLEIFISSFIK